MATRYSNLPYMTSDLIPISVRDNEVPPDTNWRGDGAIMPSKSSLVAWASAVWVMVAHFILSVVVAIFVLVYVADHRFNLTERSPLVQVIDGTRVAPFMPMQSDIVTFLSSMIAILKCALTAWAASLCWNVALFLMERRGLARRDLQVLLKFGILAPGAYSKDWSTWVIASLLLTGLVANLSSPIVTGSISWVPSNRLVYGLSNNPSPVYDVLDGTLAELSPYYRNSYTVRDTAAMDIAGSIGWGSATEKGVLKRVLTTVNALSINSTLENVTLPYFEVHSIRWIQNRNEIPFIRDGMSPGDLVRRTFNYTPSTFSGFLPGYAVLIPNVTTNWSSDPLESTIIHDTRLLALYYAYDQYGETYPLTQNLPSNAYKLHYGQSYTAYAWVTFSAGVGRCKEYSCIISSPMTIRNGTAIELEPHQLTFQALAMALVVGIYLITQNNSIPSAWDNINDYVEAILVRSYSGAWSTLSGILQTSVTNTSYVPSVPGLLAQVDQKRVFIWLVFQLFVTLLSILFLIIQFRLSNHPLLGDTCLTVFHLDTTAITRNDSDSSTNNMRKIEQQGDRLMVLKA
ncbi:hypothetical protein B0J17DRAFT_772984 [Rhizoctonia solani]|nr:hypothetical protein B0J17DRAFT_772984 [Rhizoctonia solani]